MMRRAHELGNRNKNLSDTNTMRKFEKWKKMKKSILNSDFTNAFIQINNSETKKTENHFSSHHHSNSYHTPFAKGEDCSRGTENIW